MRQAASQLRPARPFILSVSLSDDRGQRVYLDNLPTLLFSLVPRDVSQASCSDWNAIVRSLTIAASDSQLLDTCRRTRCAAASATLSLVYSCALRPPTTLNDGVYVVTDDITDIFDLIDITSGHR